MIIAGWILAILGLAQVVFSGTIEVSQLTEGNRLIGLAPSVIANADLVAQRAMIHQGGCATFLAGVIFIGAAYLKPAPAGQQSKAWTGIAAIAARPIAAASGLPPKVEPCEPGVMTSSTAWSAAIAETGMIPPPSALPMM